MERAPQFTPRSEGSPNYKNKQVVELEVVANALEADMLKIAQRAQQSTQGTEGVSDAGDHIDRTDDIGHFEVGESNLGDEEQKALRETLGGLDLIPKENLSS